MFESLLILSMGAPLAASVMIMRMPIETVRRAAVVSAAVSFVCSTVIAWQVWSGASVTLGPLFSADALSAVPMAFFALLSLLTFIVGPQRDSGPRPLAGMLLMLTGTIAAYASTSLWVFLAGWILVTIPWLLSWFADPGDSRISHLPQLMLAVSTVALGLSLAVAELDSALAALLSLVLLILAVLVRKGIFPFHSWVACTYEDALPQAASLLANGHLGAFLAVRFVVPRLMEVSPELLPWLGYLALLTAVYASVLALAERKPRRILAYLGVSQASFILAGLGNRNLEGIAGALLHWIVVVLATTGLVVTYRAVEVRFADVENPRSLLGLGARIPRLAVFFAVCGLALIGLPGTLGFAAEDLLFHGALESHPILGLTLPVATAFNAITIFRLFSTLFLGRRLTDVAPIPDAMPRERWPLTACVACLIIGGIFPRAAISMRDAAAHAIAVALSQ